jgi:hypothetical protein
MDKKSKILIIAILILIAGSVAVTYWRIMIKKDYIISAQADCDPTIEKCFVWNCDPNATDESEKCTGDAEKDTWYYKIIKRKAANIPLCDPKDENCTALTCPAGEKDCSEVFCSAETATQGEECSDLETYIKEHPEALEEEACDPETDENCPAATEEAPADTGTSESAE